MLCVEVLAVRGLDRGKCRSGILAPREADDPEHVCDRVEAIFENLPEGWSEGAVAADYTGGTKSMTAGIVLACAKPGRHLQFMKPRGYDEDGRGVGCSDPVLVDINYKVRPVRRRTSVRPSRQGGTQT
jgi:hypothetical protein